MAVVRADSQAWVATVSGWDWRRAMVWVSLACSVCSMSITATLIAWIWPDGASPAARVVGILLVTLIVAVVALVGIAVVAEVKGHRLRRDYQLVITSQGIGWQALRWRAFAPWSTIHSVDYGLNGRMLRVGTRPRNLLQPPDLPLWYRQLGGRYRVLLSELDVDAATVANAIAYFSSRSAQPLGAEGFRRR